MEVLQNYKQVIDARKKLKEKNISFIDSSLIIKFKNLFTSDLLAFKFL